jgi:hypothetical protein
MARTPPRSAPWPEPLVVPHDAERPFRFLGPGFGNDRRTLANNRPLQTFELIHYRHPAPLVIAASSAMIAAPSSVNRAAVSRSRRNRASCQSRRSNTASRAASRKGQCLPLTGLLSPPVPGRAADPLGEPRACCLASRHDPARAPPALGAQASSLTAFLCRHHLSCLPGRSAGGSVRLTRLLWSCPVPSSRLY